MEIKSTVFFKTYKVNVGGLIYYTKKPLNGSVKDDYVFRNFFCYKILSFVGLTSNLITPEIITLDNQKALGWKEIVGLKPFSGVTVANLDALKRMFIMSEVLLDDDRGTSNILEISEKPMFLDFDFTLAKVHKRGQAISTLYKRCPFDIVFYVKAYASKPNSLYSILKKYDPSVFLSLDTILKEFSEKINIKNITNIWSDVEELLSADFKIPGPAFKKEEINRIAISTQKMQTFNKLL